MKRKILQRVIVLICSFYAGLHLILMGLASKITVSWLNYLAIAVGIILVLTATGYCVVQCVIKYKALTSKQHQESESD